MSLDPFARAAIQRSDDEMVSVWHYVDGFRHAGDLLADELAKNGRGFNRYLHVPLLYCYRHFLEVVMKEVIARLESLVSISGGAASWVDPKVLGTHELTSLLQTLEGLIRHAFGDSELDGKPIASVREVVNFFARLDPSGQVLRYRYEKKSNSPNIQKVARLRLDVVKLKEKMKEVDWFFAGLSDMIRASGSEP